jgi:hypothetical protein
MGRPDIFISSPWHTLKWYHPATLHAAKKSEESRKAEEIENWVTILPSVFGEDEIPRATAVSGRNDASALQSNNC